MRAEDDFDPWTQLPPPDDVVQSTFNLSVIEGVQPLDAQFGLQTPKTVPEALYSTLFGARDIPKKATQTTDSVPLLNTYAVIDAAKVTNLDECLEASGLEHRCLFKGAAYEGMKDVAPWLVRLEEGSSFTRDLFTCSDSPQHLWKKRPGIFIHSQGSLTEIWEHLRRFTRVQDDAGKWYYFRFWEPYVLYGLAAHALPVANQICAPLHSVLAPLDMHTAGHVINLSPTTKRSERCVLLKETQSVLSKIRQHQVLVDIAETILLDGQVAPPSLDWPKQRDRLVNWGTHARQTYGLCKRKSLHSYLMIRNAMPHAFDDPALRTNEILLSQTTEADKLTMLINHLRTVGE